jgi:hypothetical protein
MRTIHLANLTGGALLALAMGMPACGSPAAAASPTIVYSSAVLCRDGSTATSSAQCPIYGLSGWTANAGNSEIFTIQRTRAPTAVTVTFRTQDGSAKAGPDYDATAISVSLPAGILTQTVHVPTHVDMAALGKTLTFGSSIYLNGTLLSNAGANIIQPAGQTCPDGQVILASQTCAVPPPPPAPTTQTCPDGTVIATTLPCPPPLRRTDIIAVSPGADSADGTNQAIGGLPFIPSEFDFNQTVGSFSVPGSAAPDVVGAFRFLCGPGQILPDDPVVYPGRPGASHLHQFYGNTSVNASTYTYASLRAGGQSTCMTGGDGPAPNRSGYWVPLMLDGKGNAVRPDYVAIYYKRLPANSSFVDPANLRFQGIAVPIPNGLDFIFGFNMLATTVSTATAGAHYWNCTGPTATQGHYPTIDDAMAHCPTTPNAAGVYNQLLGELDAPDCWDGRNLDSPDHRSHVAYASYGSWGYLKCPAGYPYVIPAFHLAEAFTVDANLGTWHLASDSMAACTGRGCSLHGDFFSAWDNHVLAMWDFAGCIDHLLNCSAGVLGNAMAIKYAGMAPPSYWNGVWTRGWLANPRLIPLSQIPGGASAM